MDRSHLNTLPAELRNHMGTRTSFSERGAYIQAPLTRVCKQLRAKSLHMFYTINTFVIEINIPDKSDCTDFCVETSDQLRRAANWVYRTSYDCHGSISEIRIDIFSESDLVLEDLYFRSSWWKNHNWWWEVLVGGLGGKFGPEGV